MYCPLNHPSGQFYHGIDYEVSDLRLGETPEKPDATMYVKGHELNVTRYVNCFVCVSQIYVCEWLKESSRHYFLDLQRLAERLEEGREER